MPNKVIQVPMEESWLKAVTRTAKAHGSTRAALVREACKRYLEKLEEEELERKHVEGYRWKPEDPSVGIVGAKLAAMVWPKEDW
jgi:metal-responsive CopG/Arc/MetJ family transcriptional regulator